MLYLASQSPQRYHLIKKAGVPFALVPSACDEELISHPVPQVLAVERARGKAHAAVLEPAQLANDPVVLAADTVTALGSTVFGKPRDRTDAVRILTRLQDTTHTVITGHCIVRLGKDGGRICEAVGVSLAKVTMRPLTQEEILAYVESGDGDQCSGGYAIQRIGDKFVIEVQGGWDTVVGLHLETVARLYHECCNKPLPGYTSSAYPMLT